MTIKVAYAKQIGTSHLLQGLPCQDSVGGIASEEAACVALADGAGSIEQSEIASDAVVATLIEEFTTNFDYWYGLDRETFADMFVDVCTEAVKTKDEKLKAVCTALICSKAKDGRTIIGHIGDGVIFGIDNNGAPSVISEPENGEEPNHTFFISGPNPNNHLRVKQIIDDQLNCIILCSDGSAKPLWNKYSNEFAPALARIGDWIKEYPSETVSQRLEKELNESFREHTQDDMSIAVLYFNEE